MMDDQTNQKTEKVEEKVEEPTVETGAVEETEVKEADIESKTNDSNDSSEQTIADETIDEATDSKEEAVKGNEKKSDDSTDDSLGKDTEESPKASTKTTPEPESLNDVLADEKKHVAPDNAKWFIIHTYAGHENKVARSLKQRVESMGFQERIFEILVPTRKTVRIVQGKKQEVEEKIFAGYVFVQMILDEETWLLVRTTQGVTAFIGPGSKPTPIPDKEVDAILKFMKTEQPMYKTGFIEGDVVKITDGPFADFEGTITNVDQERGKVKVTIMIFDRETPVELDFLQVQKL